MAPIDKDAQEWEASVRRFAVKRPDYNDVLDAAIKRGLYFSGPYAAEVFHLKSPETIYYLALPENEKEMREVNSGEGEYVNVERARDKIRRIHDRITRQRIFEEDYEPPRDPTDKYLAKRKADIKAGLRRR